MNQTREPKGPYRHRMFVIILNGLLAILVFWLLGFILDDIGSEPGPSLYQVQQQFQDPLLLRQRDALNQEANNLLKNIEVQRQQQMLLQQSTDSYRDSMNQLTNLQKNTPLTPEAQQNLTKASKLYLDNQQQFQLINASIAKQNSTLEQVRKNIDIINLQLNQQADAGTKKYEMQRVKHNLITAVFKLLVLVPLLIIAVYLFKKNRKSIYISIIGVVGITIAAKVVFVMHDHFPSRAFKYILIFLLIYFVVRLLMYLLHMVVAPKPNWLLKQYREAYQKLQCPVCQYPIQPGALKLTIPTKISEPRELGYLEKIKTYTCPSCGEGLFEKCEKCDQSRHSLLSFCTFCGANKKG